MFVLRGPWKGSFISMYFELRSLDFNAFANANGIHSFTQKLVILKSFFLHTGLSSKEERPKNVQRVMGLSLRTDSELFISYLISRVMCIIVSRLKMKNKNGV